MTAAAWIALGGVGLTVVINLIFLTRFITKLEARDELLRTLVTGQIAIADTKFQGMQDKAIMAITHAQTDMIRLEQRLDRQDTRLQNVERVVGQSANLRD